MLVSSLRAAALYEMCGLAHLTSSERGSGSLIVGSWRALGIKADRISPKVERLVFAEYKEGLTCFIPCLEMIRSIQKSGSRSMLSPLLQVSTESACMLRSSYL